MCYHEQKDSHLSLQWPERNTKLYLVFLSLSKIGENEEVANFHPETLGESSRF